MPKAAKTLNHDPLAREHDIRPKPHARHERHMLAEPQPATMQLTAKRDLVRVSTERLPCITARTAGVEADGGVGSGMGK